MVFTFHEINNLERDVFLVIKQHLLLLKIIFCVNIKIQMKKLQRNSNPLVQKKNTKILLHSFMLQILIAFEYIQILQFSFFPSVASRRIVFLLLYSYNNFKHLNSAEISNN